MFPAAIGFYCWVAIAPRNDRRLALYSENFDEAVEATLDELKIRATGKWADYPLGVAWALEQAGYVLRGANIYILGEVPLGAGLSSSAAVEVSTALALMDVAQHTIATKKLALLCQKAENEFVGARCGIMDQFISCHGHEGSALLLDLICNTMVEHKHGSGEYNVRRGECESAVRQLSRVLPKIRALRDVTLAELDNHRGLLSEIVYKRCRHVITENARAVQAATALETDHLEVLREVMAASHRSLRDDYEVSCRELDIMVELANRQTGVFGARMTGGGFGGCTINLVSVAESREFRRHIGAEYEAATGRKPNIYVCEASQGAEMVELSEVSGRAPLDF